MITHTRITHTRTAWASAALAALVLTAAPASAQDHTLRLSTFLPPSNLAVQEFERWGKELSERSDGRLALEIFPSGQFGPPPQQFALAQRGVADLSYVLHGFNPGRFPLMDLAYLPGLFETSEEGSTKLAALVDDHLAAEHPGTKVLYVIAAPPLPMFTSDAVVSNLADFDGLRIRHPGPVIAGSIEASGATPVAISPAEMGDALSKGVIDGLVSSWEAVESFRLTPAAKNATDVTFGTGTFALVMNRDAYDALPADLQTIIDETTGAEASARIGRIYDETDAAARERLGDAIAVTALPEADAAELRARFDAYRDGLVEKAGPEGQVVLDALTGE